MPLNIDILQILLHMLNFLILAGGLIFLLYTPITRFLDERGAYFAKLTAETEAAKAKADALRAEYETRLEEAKHEIAVMRADAEREMASISRDYISEAKDKAAYIVQAAEKEAEDRKEHILDAAQTEIGELVIAATQKLLSDTVTADRNAALYDEFIRLADETIAAKRAQL